RRARRRSRRSLQTPLPSATCADPTWTPSPPFVPRGTAAAPKPNQPNLVLVPVAAVLVIFPWRRAVIAPRVPFLTLRAPTPGRGSDRRPGSRRPHLRSRHVAGRSLGRRAGVVPLRPHLRGGGVR